MPGPFLQQLAPNGQRWADYCRNAQPSLDKNGLVCGPWGECLHDAVRVEMGHLNCSNVPQNNEGEPLASQVIDYLDECGYASFISALEKNESVTRERLSKGRVSFAFGPVHGATVEQPVVEATVVGQVVEADLAPNAVVVEGKPITQRARKAIDNGSLPEQARPAQIISGAKILDDNPYLPDTRPCRDLPFAILFLVAFGVVVGILAAFSSELTLLISRVGTKYESYKSMTCPGEIIKAWPDGKSTSVSGIQQRLEEGPKATSSGGTALSRRLHVGDSMSTDMEFSSEPMLELPGLSSFVRRLELFGLAPRGMEGGEFSSADETGDSSRRQIASWPRRAQSSTGQTVAVDRDCERACAAYEECASFDVEVQGSSTSCVYKKAAPTGSQNPGTSALTCSGSKCSACWMKVDNEILGEAANEMLHQCIRFTVVGTTVSMLCALMFLKLASVQPAAATHCGVYFLPGYMIVIGLTISAVLFPLVGVAGLVFGGAVFLCGGCTCGCTYFCYKDLIPFTIEVVDVVADIAMKYWSMLFVSLCAMFARIVWGFLCVVAPLAMYAGSDRENATTPQSQVDSNKGVVAYIAYIRDFFWVVVYFWGVYTNFETCHVTIAGVFGRWYFERDGHGTVGRSLKVALFSSFGSICCGSLLIAIVRALDKMANRIQRQSSGEGNAVVALLAGIVKVIILCLGDVLEWMSQYCFVQCALRGLSFWQAAKATYAMTSISNLDYFVSQVTVGWVVAMGAILCALSGALAAGLLGYYTCGIPGFGVYLAMIGGVFGCFSGMMTGGSALGVMNSGTATILMCWAETPDAWEKENPAIHEKFTAARNSLRNSLRNSAMMDKE
eukprot:TRINITY_DN3163_c0_g2_i3.p1 TRINITY_DN3163_c0_g2~~TRINITY_DN3163_c0_g2_i3.p1  ORF type:complete len:842 (+),score=76.07 TRINITY_DN3163_c0_g2_i3:55-2580(+)